MPKVVILVNVKGGQCTCGQATDEDAAAQPPAEPISEKSVEDLKKSEPRLLGSSGDYQKKRPIKCANVKYSLKNRTDPRPAEHAVYAEDKHENCFKRCCKKKKKTGESDQGPSALVVRPSQIEFNFLKDPYVSELEYYEALHDSTIKNLSFIHNRLYNLGERGSGYKLKGEPQDYFQLQEQCVAKGVLFEDPEFPAVATSINRFNTDQRLKELAAEVDWTRPKEIVKEPKFFIKEYSKFDVQQGAMNDCWFLGALANLTNYIRLFAQIIPKGQSFGDQYAGIFHFRFWQYGRWVDIVIDDRIPTINGQHAFLRSSEKNEFWSALIEKAYAKLKGSYEALNWSSSCDVMIDLTGGICETFNLKDVPPDFFKLLRKAYERASIMCCFKDADSADEPGAEGLIKGHAYSVTKVANITVASNKKVKLVRLRSPIGKFEWTGAWGEQSTEWKTLKSEEREKMGLTYENHGEFWMTYDDLIKYFEFFEICYLNPDCLIYHEVDNKKWVISMHEGQWVPGVTAGGCSNFDRFFHNPQYLITLTDADEGDKECTIIISLMQKLKKGLQQKPIAPIGLALYHVANPDYCPIPLDQKYLSSAEKVRGTDYEYKLEISLRAKLPRGTYVIIPTTFEPNDEADFLLRILTEKPNIMREHDNDTISYSDPEYKPDEKTDDQVSKLFSKIAGEDGEVDWQELKRILDSNLSAETKGRGFSSDTCRSMISMMDADLSGKLNLAEFKKLWNNILHWKGVFQQFDKDNSGTFSGYEFREALEHAGFKLNFSILNKLMLRYGNKKGELNFEDFIMCAIKIKTLIDLFEYKSKYENIILKREEWVKLAISAA